MSESRVAIRYAKAILDLAIKNKATDAVEKDMRSMSDAITEIPELGNMLGSPIIKREDKKKALTGIFKENHDITDGLLSLLVDNKRITILNEVALQYLILNEQRKGQDVAYVTTAVPLSAEMEKKVLKQLAKITDKKVTLENKVSPDILGGFILRVGDLQYDASIATKLSTIKREFSNS